MKWPQRYLFFVLLCYSTTGLGQSFNTEFGKNRVQYHDDFKYWNVYETENFLTHFYGKSRSVAEASVQLAEYYHDEIQAILEHRTNQKIQIIVYKDLADLKQSNVGLSDSFISKAGETKIVGNRMFVHFDGHHEHLRKQIKEGIANVYLNSMLFGTSLQEIVQNAVLLDVPTWYKKGIVGYAARPWDALLDDELRDILYQDYDRYIQFDNLAEDYPRIAGQSFWYYIDQNYGKSSISNLLYLTRITHSLENAFQYVLGVGFDQIKEEWAIFYAGHYAKDESLFEASVGMQPLDLCNKAHMPVSALAFSPDGRQLAYAYNDIGRYKVVLRDMATGKEEVVFKFGHRNALQATDYNYPLLAWHPQRPELSIIYQDRAELRLRLINFGKDEVDEQVIPADFDRIYSLALLDEETYIFSASTDGYSDLFSYNPRNRNHKAITQDFYDDMDVSPAKIDGQTGVIFASNRGATPLGRLERDTILPLDPFDLYFIGLEGKKPQLQRLTQTSQKSERQPKMTRENHFTYTAMSSGINNLYAYDAYSLQEHGLTNLDRNIILHSPRPYSDEHLLMYYFDGAYQVFTHDIDYSQSKTINTTPYLSRKSLSPSEPLPIPLAQPEEEIKPGYLFQSPFGDPPQLEPIVDGQKEKPSTAAFPRLLEDKPTPLEIDDAEVHDFNSSKIVASRVRFRLDNFTTKMDNNVLFEGLESSIGDQNTINYNPTGILVKANIRDLFEDHEIEAGARYPLTFDGSEYFVVYDNNKMLLDKRYALYRRSFLEGIDDRQLPAQRRRKTSWLGLMRLKYPFNVYRSLRATFSLRQDRYHTQVVDQPTLDLPVTTEERIGVKLEYVFDNTLDISLNVKNGTRYKFYVEAINRFDIGVVDGFSFDASKAFTTVVGFDARHYIPLWKHSVLALRATGASSFGSEKMMYYLGGVNNWLFSSFDQSIPQPNDLSFAFRTAVPNLRGFDFNIRNGSTYGLVNVEARIPFLQYLFKRSIRSSFFRNMQLTGFFDAGLAWHGRTPYTEDNPINSVRIERPPTVFLDVQYFRDPLVYGYGLGMRTSVFGYFLKLDYAWGVETRKVLDPKLYLSMGVDF